MAGVTRYEEIKAKHPLAKPRINQQTRFGGFFIAKNKVMYV